MCGCSTRFTRGELKKNCRDLDFLALLFPIRVISQRVINHRNRRPWMLDDFYASRAQKYLSIFIGLGTWFAVWVIFLATDIAADNCHEL